LDLQSELSRREEELNNQKKAFSLMAKALQEKEDSISEAVDRQVRSQLKSREENLKTSIREEIQAEKTLQLKELEEELMRKSAQLVKHNQTKAKLERLSREFEERETQIHLEKEKELSRRIKKMEGDLKSKIQMENDLKIQEKQAVIDSLKKKIEEARQKASQGSVQLQGEAQELILEELLRELHPSDIIEEVKKGVNGADCIQTVKTQSGIKAGQIIYESKNTKLWNKNFIKKLKQDNLKTQADIMVIVTKTLPKEIEGKYGLIDGVWVTSLDFVKDLSLLLRYGLLKTYSVMITQTDKKDKMTLLYDYLTSNEFKATFESILDGFKSLQDSHLDEQRKMQLLWKRRAKHLEQVLSSTIDFYGSIKGISETSIPTIPMLEIKLAS
jgi:hypothetical protein